MGCACGACLLGFIWGATLSGPYLERHTWSVTPGGPHTEGLAGEATPEGQHREGHPGGATPGPTPLLPGRPSPAQETLPAWSGPPPPSLRRAITYFPRHALPAAAWPRRLLRPGLRAALPSRRLAAGIWVRHRLPPRRPHAPPPPATPSRWPLRGNSRRISLIL